MKILGTNRTETERDRKYTEWGKVEKKKKQRKEKTIEEIEAVTRNRMW